MAAKKVNVLRADETADAAVYELMRSLIASYHPHLVDADIVIVWRTGWKEDADDRLILGQMHKASDMEREINGYDAAMLLNKEAWAKFDVRQRAALVDHELLHLDVARDDAGDPKEDERGRTVYRIRKHDIEEFRDIVSRHGCYKADLVAFAEEILRRPPQVTKSMFDIVERDTAAAG